MELQSLMFDKKFYYNTGMARIYLKRHNLTPIKLPDITSHYRRFRLKDPKLYTKFVTKEVSTGVKGVYGYA
jgi:hypothetical protein